MSAAGITEFLNELSESDSLSTLREAYNQRAPFIFKLDHMPVSVKATIEAFSNKRVIIATEPNDLILPTDKVMSLKFNVGTEVYFIKTQFKAHQNRFYIDMNSKVIQLKRRKEPRFLIPKNWAQSAVILTAKQNEDIKCNAVDISNSGIRLEVLQLFKPNLGRDDIIKIKFQIHKRAEVSTTAIVRFVLHRTNLNSLIGLEFTTDISNIDQQRVISIVSDIQLFSSAQRS